MADIKKDMRKVKAEKRMNLERIKYGLKELEYRLLNNELEKEKLVNNIQLQKEAIDKFQLNNKEFLKE